MRPAHTRSANIAWPVRTQCPRPAQVAARLAGGGCTCSDDCTYPGFDHRTGPTVNFSDSSIAHRFDNVLVLTPHSSAATCTPHAGPSTTGQFLERPGSPTTTRTSVEQPSGLYLTRNPNQQAIHESKVSHAVVDLSRLHVQQWLVSSFIPQMRLGETTYVPAGVNHPNRAAVPRLGSIASHQNKDPRRRVRKSVTSEKNRALLVGTWSGPAAPRGWGHQRGKGHLAVLANPSQCVFPGQDMTLFTVLSTAESTALSTELSTGCRAACGFCDSCLAPGRLPSHRFPRRPRPWRGPAEVGR